MRNKNLTIDVAKGIAIILVVYGHVIEHGMAFLGSQDFFLNPVFKVIYTFHMPLFVFISGYLMAGSLNRHRVGDVFKSRCKSLLVPFVALSVLGIIMTYILNMVFSNTGRIDVPGDLADQLLLRPSVWFLFTLFVVSSVLIYSVELEKRFGAIAFAGIYLLLMIIPYNNYCALYYIKWFYLFYLAGYFLNRYPMNISNRTVKMMIFLVSLVLFGWLVSYWQVNDYIYINKMNGIPGQYFDGLLRLGYRYITGFLGIVIAFYIAAALLKTRMAPFLAHIGVYSLDIYIIQMLLVEGIYPRFIGKANIHLNFNSPAVLYIEAPLITIFFVGVCLLISTYVIRKNDVSNKLLLGGRA